ncbi:hypothetical protein D3C86_2001750 [compost metagenome]
MIACGLARRVWAIGLIPVRFRECRRRGIQGSIYFVSRDMQKSKIFFRFFRQLSPECTDGFKQVEGADYICLDELARAMD